MLVANKTSIQPKIVPLPQGNESFIITYIFNNTNDTLFRPPKISFSIPAGTDSIKSNNQWRTIRITQSLETGGSIAVTYALPSDVVNEKIQQLNLLLWIVLPLGCLLAGIIGYRFSSRLIKPVTDVIHSANAINLNSNTALLTEPEQQNELKELIVSFNRMLLRIREQSEKQNAFFASASHELRTPLSVMQTRLQVLMNDENLSEVVKQSFSDQLQEVKRLIKMVNDFLLMSELQNNQVQIIYSTINLTEIISEIVEKNKLNAASKQLRFKISYLPANASFDLNTDSEKLHIILNNLLHNAIKYSSANELISISVEEINAAFLITIINMIRDDIHPQIREVKNTFYHSKPLYGEGFGLGLWIANQLAMLIKSELNCEMENKNFVATLLCKK